MRHVYQTFACVLLWLLHAGAGYAQSVAVEDLLSLDKKKAFALHGGLSLSTSYYHTNMPDPRLPFTYQLNGSLNASLFGMVNIPLNVNLNNYGTTFAYPSMPKRLSIHPSYKWAKAHIGDVSMSFSPYTLNGHLFTGGGVELTPGKWNMAAMGGQMTRKVAYDRERPGLLPSFDRYGYGAKVRYNGSRFFAGTTFFAAKDKWQQASFLTDSLGVYPKSNLALSMEIGGELAKNLRLSVESAVSILTRDTRMPYTEQSAVDRLLGNRLSTHFYKAMKGRLDYTFLGNTVGVGYERIDPMYETLGAYYFNNDYENFTLNYARSFYANKLGMALSGGLQRDNLDGKKPSDNKRLVGSANLTFTPGERLNMSLSASTFQGFRVLRSQFDYINQTNPYQNLDTLNFRQISRNLDFNLSWTLGGQQHGQHLAFSASYQESASEQGGYILPGNLSRLLNASVAYTLDLSSINTRLNAGMNVSDSYVSRQEMITLGPQLSSSVTLFEKKLQTGLSLSYNRTLSQGTEGAEIYNCRWNARCTLGKHHALQSDLTFQQRMMRTEQAARQLRTLNATLGYSCNF